MRTYVNWTLLYSYMRLCVRTRVRVHACIPRPAFEQVLHLLQVRREWCFHLVLGIHDFVVIGGTELPGLDEFELRPLDDPNVVKPVVGELDSDGSLGLRARQLRLCGWCGE